MQDKLDELELQLEDMATHMIFAQMTIQQAESDLRQREDTLQEVHKMRAGERVGWGWLARLRVRDVWCASLTSLSVPLWWPRHAFSCAATRRELHLIEQLKATAEG